MIQAPLQLKRACDALDMYGFGAGRNSFVSKEKQEQGGGHQLEQWID